MAIIFHEHPEMTEPELVASWPGIGNIGVLAVETLRNQLGAVPLADIEPYNFFYPRKIVIRSGVLEDLEFPASRFYHVKFEKKDLIFFIGDEQPVESAGNYAQGRKAYEMGNLVLDVAQEFGCRRIYTSGAAVALTHHSFWPRVWTVATHPKLVDLVKSCHNTILMGEVEGLGGTGSITGLNGLLLGLAKQRGFEGICFMGEVPDYLSGAPFPYPRASRAVAEVLASILRIKVDYGVLDKMTAQIDDIVKDIYERLPRDIKDRVEQRKQPGPGVITDEDSQWMKEHIEELFKKGGKSDERAS